MREMFECAVLQVPDQAGADPIDGGGRLKLHLYDLALAAGGPNGAISDTTGLIAASALALQRYDACLLYVEPANLPWVRIALSRARSVLRTPVLALVREVKAAALADLLALGVMDFLRVPVCSEELRARLLHLPGRGQLQEPASAYGAASSFTPIEIRPTASHLQRSCGIDIASYEPDESFRQAKARIVSGFERAYLHQILSRHDGNVARAARAVNKHRRAFWALMHKHAIDAKTYRAAAAAQSEYDAPPLAGRPRRSTS
ncbi:helix-turn-helix domain-containing protein [Bordetella sp. FB-8]|uniref:helix-turn-helix domain-containing protein n=1 Tax=Bordetella sp. FB-8 TaxID=1159870 RepID=UPI000367281C|nr:helix-turn-helix domain-containing protein [Bordetella sp. FB-8]